MKTAEEKREVDKTETNVKEEAAEKTERIEKESKTNHVRPEKIRIYGIGIDDAGRCVHYHKTCDIAALKCAACGKYYACFSCHDEMEDHPFAATGLGEPAPVLCGICKSLLSREEYGTGACPHCGTAFNPGCKIHKDIYFR